MIPQSEKEIPEILSEEDSPPLGSFQSDNSQSGPSLPKEKKANIPLDVRKFSLGSSTLGWCVFLMFLCIILSIWNPENELIKSGFEAFKLIVMTILGYIFGSNNSNDN